MFVCWTAGFPVTEVVVGAGAAVLVAVVMVIALVARQRVIHRKYAEIDWPDPDMEYEGEYVIIAYTCTLVNKNTLRRMASEHLHTFAAVQ